MLVHQRWNDLLAVYTVEATPYTLMGNMSSGTLDVNTGLGFTDATFCVRLLLKNNASGGSSQLFVDGISFGTGTGTRNLDATYFLGGWNSNRMNSDLAEVLIYPVRGWRRPDVNVDDWDALYGVTEILTFDRDFDRIRELRAIKP